MKIIPKLNLNKSPKDVDNYSLVDATNIIIDNSTNTIKTENSLTDLIANIEINGIKEDRQLFYAMQLLLINGSGGDLNNKITIKHIHSCSTELIIFVYYDYTKQYYIFRYKEDNKTLKLIPADIELHDLNILVEHIYNRNNLILAISEYSDDDTYKIPLKVINIGEFDNDLSEFDKSQLYNKNFHSIIPEVRIPRIEHRFYYSNIYKGWYFIFIKYKIDSTNYTQWYNTNKSIYIDSYNIDKLLDYSIADNYAIDGDDSLGRHLIIDNTMSDQSEISNVSFEITIKNIDTRYKYFKLGFICCSKSYTKCYETDDLTNTSFLFAQNNIIESSVNDLIMNFHNYYNVKSLSIKDNRLYIGNYIEDSYFMPNRKALISIKTTYKQFNNTTIDNTYNTYEVTYNETKNYWVCQHGYFERYYHNDCYWVGYAEYESINFSGTIPAYDNKDETCIYIKLKDMPCFCVYDYYHISTLHSVGQLFGEHNIVELSWYSLDWEHAGTPSKPYKEIATFIEDMDNIVYVIEKNNIKVGYFATYINDVFTAIENINYSQPCINIHGNPKNDGWAYSVAYEALANYTITKEEHYTSPSTESINYLNTLSIYPGTYRFYVCYVDKYGNTSIANAEVQDSNSKSGKSSYVNLTGFSENKQYLVGTVSHELVYNDWYEHYIGWYLAYSYNSEIIYKGIGIIPNKESKNIIHFYSDELNFSDSISLNINKVRLFNTTKADRNLNCELSYNDYNGWYMYTDFSIENINIYPADSFNNLNASTKIVIVLDRELDDNEFDIYNTSICHLINTNYNSNKNKPYEQIIPCTQVYYYEENGDVQTLNQNVPLEINNAFFTNIHALVSKGKIYNNALKIYQSEKSINAANIPYKFYTFKDIYPISFESLRFNNSPAITLFPILGLDTDDEKQKSFAKGFVIETKNTIDLFKHNIPNLKNCYPKYLVGYDNVEQEYNTKTFKFPQTIRRSNIIQDESLNINWRYFNTEQYKNIIENKGDVVKIVSLGHYLLVHTEHSMFLFDASDSLRTNNNNKLQLANTDIWDISYKEILTSDLGYAGIQKEWHGTIGSFGYIFYDKSNSSFYRLDEDNKLILIDDDIRKIVKQLNADDVRYVDDKQRDRLLITLIKNDNIQIILSYNYKYNIFISRHTYRFNKGVSTKNNVYLMCDSDIYSSKIMIFKDDDYGNFYEVDYDINNKNSTIDILINTDYDHIKFLEYIKYKVNSIIESEINYHPIENNEKYYAGDEITIFSEFCNTGIIEVNPTSINDINNINSYDKPYWRFGNWHFNLIRNKLEDFINGDVNSDNMSRIYGNWFVVRFRFNSGTQKSIENLDCKFNLDIN